MLLKSFPFGLPCHFTIVVELFSTFLQKLQMHPTTARHTVLINEVNGVLHVFRALTEIHKTRQLINQRIEYGYFIIYLMI